MDKAAAARVEALRQASGWDDLTEVLNEHVEKHWAAVMAHIKAGHPVDQRVIDFERGVTHGIRILLNAPEKAARIYERHNQEVKVAD